MSNIEDARQIYSVYSVADPTVHLTHPLDFLRGDNEHGWLVARNLRKALNHLETLRWKDNTATELMLHGTRTDGIIFDEMFTLLQGHQERRVATDDVIRYLSARMASDNPNLTQETIKKELRDYAVVPHMEFHPSDVCNLTCIGCTYGHDDPETKPLPINYPFAELNRISSLHPKSMVIVGGGEPTLYRDDDLYFPELVTAIIEQNPGIKLALKTNGTHKPEGDWPSLFSYIRVSIDAATPETFTKFRGKPMFERVIKNYLDYLDYDAPYVGISFLFSNVNIHEYVQVAKFLHDLVKDNKPDKLHKVNVQYRPLRQDPFDYDKPFKEAVSEEQIEQTIDEVVELAHSSDDFEDFLSHQTNITAIVGGNTHPPYMFSRCNYSQIFRIVRANGDVRPCFIRVKEPDFLLGNVITDPPETIALNMLYVAAARKEHCNSQGCRQSHVNYILEQGLIGEMQPSMSDEVLRDPMF